MLSEMMKRSVNILHTCGGMRRVCSFCSVCKHYMTDSRGGCEWDLEKVRSYPAVHATVVGSLHRQTRRRLFQVEDTTVYFIIMKSANYCARIRDKSKGAVLPLMCFFEMKKNRSSPPKIGIYLPKFHWLLPKSERFIQKEIQIYLFIPFNRTLIIVALHF